MFVNNDGGKNVRKFNCLIWHEACRKCSKIKEMKSILIIYLAFLLIVLFYSLLFLLLYRRRDHLNRVTFNSKSRTIGRPHRWKFKVTHSVLRRRQWNRRNNVKPLHRLAYLIKRSTFHPHPNPIIWLQRKECAAPAAAWLHHHNRAKQQIAMSYWRVYKI